MSGIPVVIAENGRGIPVVAVEKNGAPATVAANGLGIPIVLTDKNGIPMVIEGLPEPEPEEP